MIRWKGWSTGDDKGDNIDILKYDKRELVCLKLSRVFKVIRNTETVLSSKTGIKKGNRSCKQCFENLSYKQCFQKRVINNVFKQEL